MEKREKERFYVNQKSFYFIYCVVPETIHTFPMESCRNPEGWWDEGGLGSQTFLFPEGFKM